MGCTGIIEVLFPHIHSIVCDYYIEGLFLKCPKSCQMAAHDLKLYISIFFSWVFGFLVLIGVTPTFSNLGLLLKIDIRNCPLLGKLLSVWRTISVLPKSAQSAHSAQTVENSHSFFNVFYTWYKSLYGMYLQKNQLTSWAFATHSLLSLFLCKD